MDTPEKIYLQQYDKNTLIRLNKWNISDEWTNKPFNEKVATNIEYTRTDAFIERAVSYLEGTLFNEVCYGEIRPDIVQAYINDFKKAMEQ